MLKKVVFELGGWDVKKWKKAKKKKVFVGVAEWGDLRAGEANEKQESR